MPKTAFHLPSAPKHALAALGKLLSLRRKERKWRQDDLAERAGVSRQTIARLEAGDPTVAAGHYFSTAWLLDVPLFPGMETSPPQANQLLIHILELLENKYPQRISALIERQYD